MRALAELDETLKTAHGEPIDFGLAKCVELVSSAADVLVIGDVGQEFLVSLDAQGCTVTYLREGSPGVKDAQEFRSAVEVLPLSANALPASVGGTTFDVVLFAGALDRFHEPSRLLIDLRRVLRKGGFVVAPITNSDHGAIRLAVLKSAPARRKLGVPVYFRGLTKQSMTELFLQAGFSFEVVEHVCEPIFGAGQGLPKLERRDFPRALVADVEAGSHSEVYQFIVKAVPASMTGDQPSLEIDRDSAIEEIAQEEGGEDTSIATVLQLGGELEAEQATRNEMVSALEEAGLSAAALESRLHKTAALRESLVQELCAKVAEYEKAWSALYLELEDARAQAAQLKREVGRHESESEEVRALLSAERELAAEREDTRLKLAAHLNALRDELIEERSGRQQLEEQLESARRQSEIKASSADEAERRAQALQMEVDHGSEFVADLLVQLAAKERQISENAEHAGRLEREWTEFHEQLAVQTLSTEEAHQRAASLQIQVDRGAEYVADLLAQLAEKEQQILKAAEQAADERQRIAGIEDVGLKLTAQLTGLQGELEAERDRRRKQVEAETSRAEEVRQRALALQVQVDRGAEYVAELLEQLAAKETQISDLISERQVAQAKVNDLAGSVSVLEDELKSLRNAIRVQPSADETRSNAAEPLKQATSSKSSLDGAVRYDNELSGNQPEGDRFALESRPTTSTRLKGEIDKLKRAREKLGETLGTGRSR